MNGVGVGLVVEVEGEVVRRVGNSVENGLSHSDHSHAFRTGFFWRTDTEDGHRERTQRTLILKRTHFSDGPFTPAELRPEKIVFLFLLRATWGKTFWEEFCC